jgi:hypothetical protein
MVRFVSWRARESFVHISVCEVKVYLRVAHLTFLWKFGKTDLSFSALKSSATRSAGSG